MGFIYELRSLASKISPIATSLPAIAFAIAIAGCSTVRLGYSQLDTIALWTADRYFDLDERQTRMLRTRFHQFHEWHRKTQLPDYAEFLAQAKTRLERGLTAADVDWFIEGLRRRYVVIVERGMDDAVTILLTITAAQLEVFQARMDKMNRRFASEYEITSSIEEQRRATVQRTLELCRDWFGSLSVPQEQLVHDHVERMVMIGPLRQQDRIRRQREFLALMQLRGKPEVFRENLEHYFIHWDAGRSPEYQRDLDQTRRERIALLVALDRTLTPHQRALAAGRIQNYIDDFWALAGRPGAQAASAERESKSQ